MTTYKGTITITVAERETVTLLRSQVAECPAQAPMVVGGVRWEHALQMRQQYKVPSS